MLEGQSAKNIHESLVAAYVEYFPSYTTGKLLAREFQCGRACLQDNTRSGRPSASMTKENIENLHQRVHNKSIFPSYTTGKLWAREFQCGRPSLQDYTRSGRPSASMTKENVETLHQRAYNISIFPSYTTGKLCASEFQCGRASLQDDIRSGRHQPVWRKKIITKTRLYNFGPLKPHFYIVKLGFTVVCIIFLILLKKHRLWVLVRTASARRF